MDSPRVHDLDVRPKTFKLDTMLRQKSLVFSQSGDQVSFGDPLLPPPWRLRRDHSTFDTGFDAITAGLAFIAPHLSLLAQDAGRATRHLHDIGQVLGIVSQWGR